MKYLSTKDLMRRFGVGQHTVYSWVNNGELEPINLAPKEGGRPKYAFTPEAVEAFERSRTVRRGKPTAPARRRKKKDLGEFGL